METALLDHGPLAVAIDAGDYAFQAYRSGVVTSGCGLEINHGVVIVGFGIDDVAGQYWIVKNSWGTNWGDAGYIKIAKDAYVAGTYQSGQCAINRYPSYPLM